MMFSSNELELASSNQLRLKISPADQERAWRQAQSHSNAIARYNAYLNRVCLSTFISWLEDWLQEESVHQPFAWPNEDSLPSIWEVVNGTAIQLDRTRLVFIPCESLDLEEFCVPQEWVDIPTWAADYYLAVQVNLDGDEDDCWIRAIGFTTHRQLKNSGRYNANNRTYVLAAEQLNKNLTVMLVTQGLCLQEEVASLSTVSDAEVKNLLLTLGDSSVYSPRLRLDVPFDRWAALLADDRRRQELYDWRRGNLQGQVASARVQVAIKEGTCNLSQWFQNIYEVSWQTVEDILSTLGTSEPNLAYGYRSAELDQEISPAIPALIEILHSNGDKSTLVRAADLLGHIALGNKDAIIALTDLLHTSEDDDIRHQAAISLGKIDPGNSAAGVRRGKLIDLGLLINGHRVILVATLIPEAARRTNINFRVYPTGGQIYLPPNLQLMVLDESGETILAAQSRSADNSIQVGFRGDRGDGFSVKVAVGDASFIEDFII